MQISKAIGGPRDGVKLSAPYGWDGRILLPRKNEKNGVYSATYYLGRYVWSDDEGWKWEIPFDQLTHRHNGNRGVCGAGDRYRPTAILLTTKREKVTCPACLDKMKQAQNDSRIYTFREEGSEDGEIRVPSEGQETGAVHSGAAGDLPAALPSGNDHSQS